MGLKIDLEINLPASKSESNRALIIQALAKWQSGIEITLQNLSEANDTKILKNILHEEITTEEINAQDAGTTFRFLTAYFAITNQKVILTGTPRMQQRPVGILVDALQTLGANITYIGKAGFPPVAINGFKQKTQNIEIQADTSSQFASALLLIAPLLPQGLCLKLVGKIASKPYIDMTLAQMAHFGIKAEVDWAIQQIHIPPQPYKTKTYTIENDWSAASYWYSALAMLQGRQENNLSVLLKGLQENSFQGDKILTTLMTCWGIKSKFIQDGLLVCFAQPALPATYTLDFTNFPDLAQTLIPLISQTDTLQKWNFIGLESLRIKETDRIKALQAELLKFGIQLCEVDKPDTVYGGWVLRKIATYTLPTSLVIETYQDHRMAMGFAPLLLRQDFEISNTEVVHKSYPNFWVEWQKFYDFVKSYL